ncbi:expressed unknown protein [Seminavis robusta]|uniref:Uncharacterized protein n=1 Tax=Seminavis robusta TaxID=568900 RepID=A0A9N8DGI8_9STRA|nr:expressed unknown protein [Seminavis robusta]|eukprot:Sro80_g042954.1  (733) ;mRNA; r:22150-24348
MEEDGPFTVDARTCLFTSAADRRKKAMKHFNRFLEGYCIQIGIDVVTANDIPYRGIQIKKSSKAIAEFWSSLFGNFIYYIANKTDLAKSSAEQYCSGMKVFFVHKFRNENDIPVFQRDKWRELLDKLRGFYRESNRAAGTRSTGGKASSTRQDREAMATACIWLKTPQYAEFWHLLNTSYHCSGRGSEVSLIKPTDTTTVEVNEFTYSYNVLSVYCQRQKDNDPQQLPIYPHRDGVLEDFYFSLLYVIVLNGCDNEYTFPIFSKAALKTKSGTSDSKVSKEWSKIFDQLRDTFEFLADEINDELSSHSNRKGSNQAMAECLSLNGMAGVFRTGWSLGSVHSVFDYVFGSLKLSHQAGKSLANWTTKIGDVITGGQPPSFDDIESDVDTLKKFTSVLFRDDTNRQWSPKVRELLVMTLLLRYNEFCEILESHPLAKLVEDEPSPDGFTSSTVRDNPFLCRIHQALEKVHAMDLFGKWVEQARQAFLSRNMPALPIEMFPRYGGTMIGSQVLMDPRCIVDHFNTLAGLSQANHMRLLNLEHKVNDIRNAIQNESRITSTFVVQQMNTMAQAIQRLESHLVGEAPKLKANKPKGIIKFSVAVDLLPKYPTLTDTTVAFFLDDYRTGYTLDQRSDSWGEMSKSERKSIANKFGCIKRAVKTVLMHADEFPLPEDKEEIKRIATAAEERIRDTFGFDPKAIITPNKLERQLKTPKFREIEKQGELPINTPDDWKSFF